MRVPRIVRHVTVATYTELEITTLSDAVPKYLRTPDPEGPVVMEEYDIVWIDVNPWDRWGHEEPLIRMHLAEEASCGAEG